MTTFVKKQNAVIQNVILQNNVFTKQEIIFIILVGLYMANVFNKGIVIAFLLLPIVIWKFLSEQITKRAMVMSGLLLAFSAYYSFTAKRYGFTESNVVFLGYLFVPIVMYLAGYIFVKTEKRYKESYWLFMIVTISTLLFSVLSIFRTIRMYGSLENASPMYGGRAVMSYWGDNFLSATGMNTYVSLAIALAPVLLLKDKNIKHIKLMKFIMMICVFMSLYVSIKLGNRTGILILMASFMTVFIFTTKFSSRKIANTVVGVIILLFGYLIYYGNVFGVKSNFESTMVGQRIINSSELHDPRFTAWGEAFNGLFNYPLGGRHTILSLRYAHNLWLDVGYDVGIIPFLLIVLFTLFGIISIKKFLKGNHPTMFKGLIISSFTAIIITCFLEPIIQGWFYYFTVFCLYLGVIHKHILIDSINQSEKKEKKEK